MDGSAPEDPEELIVPTLPAQWPDQNVPLSRQGTDLIGLDLLTQLVMKYGERSGVCVTSIADGNLRLGLRQLRLGQLHDAAQAELIAPLREIESHVGLSQHLPRHADALKCVLRVEHRSAYIARDAVTQIPQLLL